MNINVQMIRGRGGEEKEEQEEQEEQEEEDFCCFMKCQINC
jgi:hypothetical protein